jgi:two-component system chemotaxis response regulator CheB
MRARAAAELSARGRQHPRTPPLPRRHSAEVIGICASTGGPHVLESIFSRLPPGYSIPILVVQHMAPGFLAGLIGWLEHSSPVAIGQARDGHRLAPGVWFAPDGAHLKLEATRRLVLDSESTIGKHRPSGDVLLHSLAAVAGAKAVAVVLTGMGNDGAAGLEAVSAAGGLTIAQDEDSSNIYGMPRIAAERGAQSILAPEAISQELASLDRQRGRR